MSLVSLPLGRQQLLQRSEGVVVVQFTYRADCDVALMGLYELADGSKGMVQVWLDATIGALADRPFVMFRNTLPMAAPRGFTEKRLEVNLAPTAELRRLVVFASTDGEDNKWNKVHAPAATILHPTQGIFDFRLGQTLFGFPSPCRFFCRSCVLLTLEFNTDGTVILTPRGTYFKGAHKEIAKAYGLEMNFTSGSTP